MWHHNRQTWKGQGQRIPLVTDYIRTLSSVGRAVVPSMRHRFNSCSVQLILYYAEEDQKYGTRSFENKLLTLCILDWQVKVNMQVKILPSAPLTKKAQMASAILPSMFCRFDSCLGHQTILKKFTKAIFFYGFQLHQKKSTIKSSTIKSFQLNHNITKSFIGLWNILFNLINLSFF